MDRGRNNRIRVWRTTERQYIILQHGCTYPHAYNSNHVCINLVEIKQISNLVFRTSFPSWSSVQSTLTNVVVGGPLPLFSYNTPIPKPCQWKGVGIPFPLVCLIMQVLPKFSGDEVFGIATISAYQEWVNHVTAMENVLALIRSKNKPYSLLKNCS